MKNNKKEKLKYDTQNFNSYYENRFLLNKINVRLSLMKNPSPIIEIWIFTCYVSFSIARYLLVWVLYDSIFHL